MGDFLRLKMGVQKPNWVWKDIWNGLHGTSSAIAKFNLTHSSLSSQSSAGAFHLQRIYQQLSPTIKHHLKLGA